MRAEHRAGGWPVERVGDGWWAAKRVEATGCGHFRGYRYRAGESSGDDQYVGRRVRSSGLAAS
jgi:hypothetical protein